MLLCKKILWVEDDQKFADSLKPFFEKKGFELECTSDANHAIRLITQNSYDAYIFDDDFNGFRLGNQLIKTVRLKGIKNPIFILSAYGEIEQNLKEYDHISYISKWTISYDEKDISKLFYEIEAEVLRTMLDDMKAKYGDIVNIQKLVQSKIDKHYTSFIISPFNNLFDNIYLDHIKPVVEKSSFDCIRADEVYSVNPIIDDILNLIHTSDMLIAELTGRNPNVFYELGIAHALKKPVILISQNIKDIPFDIKHLRCIIYKYTPRGMKEFENKLAVTISKLREDLFI